MTPDWFLKVLFDFYNSAEYKLNLLYNNEGPISQSHDNNLLISHKRVTAAIVLIIIFKATQG